jgi:AraC-like DNA-binding protein
MLKTADKFNPQFFADFYHEIHSSLALITGTLEQVLAENPEEKLAIRANMMYRNSRKLQNLIDRLPELATSGQPGEIQHLIRIGYQLQHSLQQGLLLHPHRVPEPTRDNEFIKEVQTIIEANLSEPEFSVQQLANKLYISKSTLYRKIEALSGESPKIFIRSFRLERAAQLLQAHFGNVTEVAFAVSFNSTPYFTKCFKEKFHQLPLTYQKLKD